MKNNAHIILFSLIGLLLTNCKPAPIDYSSASNIVMKWELVTNFTNVDGAFDARFILDNQSNIELANNNWKLFFSMYPRTIIAPPREQRANLEHINGDWWQIVPDKGFSLKQNESVEIFYRGMGGVVKETDGPLGAYFVFYNEDGSEQQIVEVDCEILPFTKPDQLNRGKEDHEPIPTPEYRYHNNKELSEVSKNQLMKIIPSPVQLNLLNGSLSVDGDWTIAHDDNLKNEADYLADKLKSITGLALNTSNSSTAQHQIELKTGKINVNGTTKEAYHLNIKDGGIQIIGNDAAGVFYGVQSLLALVPLKTNQNHSKSLPNQSVGIKFEQLSIQDAPRFGFRGLHLDLVRNFQNKETIFRLLDLISFYKLNKLFIYLSDDEGWRLEIPGLPELTEVGAQRKHTDSYQDAVLHPAYGSGPYAYGKDSHGSGFISRNDFIELLKYAKARHIQVIPGVNFPGHARSAIKPMEARYNRLIAEGKEKEANEYRLIDPNDKSVYLSAQSYKDNVVSVANASTYRFYKKVMDEIALMYKDAGLKLKEIHTGGDEVPEGAWTASPLATDVLKNNPEYKDPKNLQAYFFKRLLNTLKNDNYKIHGWEEVALLKKSDGSYDTNPEFVGKNIIPHVWNNVYEYKNQDLTYRIANAGYDVILCPATNFYLDDAYDKDPKEPGSYWSGFIRTRDTWTFAPYDFFKTTTQTLNGREINIEKEYANMEKLKPEARKRILGLQAQIWSETIKGRDMIEYYMLPKLLGFVESAWAKERVWETMEDKEEREKAMNSQWNLFANTLAQKELPRLSYQNGGYNYRIPLPGAILENGKLLANIEFPGLELRYTTDGSEPVISSTKYEGPIGVSGKVRMKAFDASGKGSRTIVLNN